MENISPPAKRKKLTVEHMDIDSPRVTRSNSPLPRSPIQSYYSLRPHSPLHHHASSLRPNSPRPSSNYLHPTYHISSPLRPRSPRVSTPPRSPLRPSSPLPSSSLSFTVFSPPVPSPNKSPSEWEEEEEKKEEPESREEEMRDGDSVTSASTSTSPSPPRRRKITSGGESKHSLVARVKKILNERLHATKPVLLAWLQKYLSDQRLSDYCNKLQFQIDTSSFGTRLPISVVASPIIPNDPSFLKISNDLSGPILTDYPGIFHETDIPDEMRERTETHGLHLNHMVAEVLAEIMGKCWDSLGGIIKFHGGANISITGTHKYYDLVARYWIKEAKTE